MKNGLNALMLGNNTKHALMLTDFCDDVFIFVNKRKSIFNRLNSDLNKLNVIYYKKINPFTKAFIRVREIKTVVKQKKIDIIFTNRKDDLIYTKIAFFFNKNKPIVLCTFKNSLAWNRNFKTMMLSKAIKKSSDGCICLAKEMFCILEQYIGASKLIYLPNAIYSDGVSKKTNYEFCEGAPIRIVYTATIYENKNQSFAIKTIKELNKKFDVTIDFIGEVIGKKYFALLKKEIASLGIEPKVNFVGSIDNDILKEKVLNTYDLYFSPSLKEMSPLNILEAKASGLPVVASHAFGQQDLIRDGLDGYLYEDENIHSAVQKLESLIVDINLRKKFGKNAKNYCETINTPQHASKVIEEYIKQKCKKE